MMGSEEKSNFVSVRPFDSISPPGSKMKVPFEVIQESWEDLQRENFVLKSHTDAVLCCAINNEESQLASGSADKTIKIWNLKDKIELLTLENHESGVTCIEYHPSGSYLISSEKENGRILLWNLEEFKQEHRFEEHKGPVISLAFNPRGDIFASGSQDTQIIIWDFLKRAIKAVLSGHLEAVNSLSYCNDGSILASGSSDKTIKIWNSFSNTEGIKINVGVKVLSVAFNPFNFQFLASLGSDNCICIWDLNISTIIHSLKVLNDDIVSIAYSPNGVNIISGSSGSTIRIWNVSEKEAEISIKGHSDIVQSITFFPSGKSFISTSSDKSIKIWNSQEHYEDSEFKTFQGEIYKFILSKDMKILVAVGQSNNVWIYDFPTGTKNKELLGHTKYISSVCFNCNDAYLATSSFDKSIIVWDMQARSKHSQYLKDNTIIRRVAFSPDSKSLAGGCDDYTITLWDFETTKICGMLVGHTGGINSLEYSPNGHHLLSASYDFSVRLWSIRENTQELKFVHGDSCYFGIFISNGKKIATCSDDKTVKVWNLQSQEDEYSFNGHLGTISGLSVSSDGEYLASISDDCTIKVWNLSTFKEEITLNIHGDVGSSVYFTSDDAYLVNNCKGSIQIWSLKEKLRVQELLGHTKSLREVIFIDKIVASASVDSTIKFWDLETMKLKSSLVGHSGIIWSISASPDRKLLASSSGDKTIRIWNIADEKTVKILNGHTEGVVKVAFSPDGKILGSSSYDKTIKLWDIESEKVIDTLYGHSQIVWSIKFIKNGDYLISVSDDKAIRIWNLKEKGFQELLGHLGSIYSLAVSPDEKFFATGSADKLVKIWNFSEKREEISFSGHTEAVWSVNYHPSGKFLASAGDDSTIRVWNIQEQREEYILGGESCNCSTFSQDGTYLAGAGHIRTLRIWFLGDSQNYNQKNTEIAIQSSQRAEFNGQSFGIHVNFQHFLHYYNVVSNIKNKTFDQISVKSVGIRIGPNEFTPVHYLAYHGLSKPLELLCKTKYFIMKADTFEHSPLYYCIKKQHRSCTDMLLEGLATLAEKGEKSLEFITSFHSIRHDLSLIIMSSSTILNRFLAALLYPRTSNIYSGAPIKSLPTRCYSKTPVPTINGFIREKRIKEDAEYIPLVIKTTHFPLPIVYGSDLSIKLLNTILSCSNEEIFRTPFIQHLIRKKWDDLIIWIYITNLLEWLNIIFIVVWIAQTPYLLSPASAVIVINLLLILWEITQFNASRKNYFKSAWTGLDIIRLLTNSVWIILFLLNISSNYFTWSMLVLNIIKGLVGFRCFDMTRFYVRLVLQALDSVKYFLLVFLYTTLSFGILNSAAVSESNFGFTDLWIVPYNLGAGISDQMETGVPDLQYFSFCLALLVNIVFMMNLIISILGNAHDEFQTKSDIINYKEMGETVLDIEFIMNLSHPKGDSQYLSICVNPYDEGEDEWGGRVKEIKSLIEKNQDQLKSRINGLYENGIELQTRLNEFDNRIITLESNLNKKLEEIIRIVSKK